MSAPRHVELGPGAEFDRIRLIWERMGERARWVGDDCAVVEFDSLRIAISTDLAIEDTHFRRGWLAPVEIGWRATAAALSDLAAVAATPSGVLVSVGLPADLPTEYLTDLMDGAADAAHSVGGQVWGGDLVRSAQIVVDVTVVGRVIGRMLTRSGVQAGDSIWVTGALGGSRAAVEAWAERREPDSSARERFAHPTPRVAEAAWLRDRGAKAMIDLSDGLVPDARHLVAASNVSLIIDADLVPVHPSADGWQSALASGEEYELLLAMPSDTDAATAGHFQQKFGVSLTRIGSAAPGSGVRVEKHGKTVEHEDEFSHF